MYIYIFTYEKHSNKHVLSFRWYEFNVQTQRTKHCTSVVHVPDHRLAVPRVPFARQNADVRSPKGRIAQRIAHGIYQRIYVAQCVEKVPQLLRNALLAVVG